MDITFLGASIPLTKRIYADGSKDAYPLVKNFTSYTHDIKTLADLYAAINEHAGQNHCLLKGTLLRPLKDEPRAGTTRTDDSTQWVCLDFDRHESESIDDDLTRLGLGDVSYIIQYSSSHGLPDNEGTVSAHVFMLLDKPMPAPTLKSWLMGLNLDHLSSSLRLSRSEVVMSWPLDITTCQNDKLLYIAPPVFVRPAKDPLFQRIKLIKRDLDTLPVERIGERNINVLKKAERAKLNELRVARGLDKRTAKTTWVGAVEVQNKPDVCSVTGIKEAGDWVRLNINGGDSWAYCHPKDNFELIHDFKTDSWYRTKELVPSYYQACVEARAALTATPNDDGDLILAFRDLKTAEYYNGLWNPQQKRLELYKARSERQLDDWVKSHGRHPGEFIPIWSIEYDPRNDWVVDEVEHRINVFKPSAYMLSQPDHDHTYADFPTIHKLVQHVLADTDGDLVEHFLNWFAVIFQRKAKPITAWVVHGKEGTGKGTFFNKVAAPLLNHSNATSIRADNLEDQFNAFLEGKLFVFVDEVDVDDFKEKGRVTSKLRNYITEPTIQVRRMRQTSFDMPNHMALMFASNRPKPVFIPPSDRRYNVGNFQPEKYMDYDPAAIEKELPVFAEWLQAHTADVSKANAIIETDARKQIQDRSVSSMQETCNAILDGDFDKLWFAVTDDELINRAPVQTPYIVTAQQYTMLMHRIGRDILSNPSRTLSRDEMGLILQHNVGNIRQEPNRLTSLLRHNGIETKRIRHFDKNTYGIKVEWKVSEDVNKELFELFSPQKKLRTIK